MGSKGTATQTQSQSGTSTYTPNAAITGAGSQALGMAQSAASTPYNLPNYNVANFNPQQQQAFQQYGQAQGIYQPYYDQAQSDFNQSTQAPNVNQFLNPYASNVLSQLSNQQQQQMSQLTGSATQTAGGVGADRIGVAQGQLANQQSLATGQTLAGIYGSALSAAQQQQQLQQSAGYGLGNLGGANLNSALSATGALYGSGAYQQQQNQSQLNAGYQNQMQQAAYPYQNAQYLANITGGLSGAFGGTTNTSQYGTSTSTPAQPSIYSQILGLGTAGAGLYGGLNSGSGTSGPTSMNGQLMMPQNVPGFQSAAYGGRIEGYEDGGEVTRTNPYLILPKASNDNTGGLRRYYDHIANDNSQGKNVYPIDDDPLKGYAPGGGVPDPTQGGASVNPNWMNYDPSIPSGKITAAPVNIPKITPLNMNMNSGNNSSQSSGPSLSDIASTALKIGTMFANRGGAVPHFDDGGDVSLNDRFKAVQDGIDNGTLDRSGANTFDNDFRGPQQKTPLPSIITDGTDGNQPSPYQAMAFAGNGPPRANVGATTPPADDETTPLTYGEQIAAKNKKEMQGTKYDVPYDTDTKGDTGRSFAKSPWMALMNAGFAMMAGNSPYAGINIGKGLLAGSQTLENQRKDTREEETINQRAKQLAMTAQQHLDEYTRMKPADAARVKQAQDQLEKQGWQKGAENLIDGSTTWFNTISKESGVLKRDGTWTSTGKGGNNTPPTTPPQAAPPAPSVQPPPQPPVQPPGPPPSPPMPPQQPPVPPQQPPAPGAPQPPPPGATPPAPPVPPPAPPPAPPQQQAEAPPPYGVKELAPNLEPGQSGITYMGKGSPLGAAANKDAQVQIAANVKAAQQEGPLRQDIGNMKLAVATLTKDADKDSFLSQLALQPGASFGERLEAAKKANAIKIAAGEPPPFDPQKVAAAETINKIQNRMGLTFSSQISPREAFAGQKIGIESSPGLTNSPQGMRRLLATFEGLADQSRDERAFFQNYLQKNGTSLGWKQDFIKKNPDERYVVNSILGTLPPTTTQHLSEDVGALRKDPSEKNKKLFDQHYADTADYFLKGKI